MESDGLLTIEEVALRLNLSPKTVAGWHRAGLIPRVKITQRVIRLSWTEVVAALRRNADKGGVRQCRLKLSLFAPPPANAARKRRRLSPLVVDASALSFTRHWRSHDPFDGRGRQAAEAHPIKYPRRLDCP